MLRRLVKLLMVLLTALTLSTNPVSASGAVTSKFEVPPFKIWDACAGRTVEVTGTAHVRNLSRTLEDGTFIYRFGFNYSNLKGIAEDGTRYIVQTPYMSIYKVAGDSSGFTDTTRTTSQLVSPGQGLLTHVRFTRVVTYHDGVWDTTFKSSDTIRCEKIA